MMKDKTSLAALFANMKEQLALLAFSGVGGVLSAMFPGGVLAHVINAMTGAGVLSCLAAGFLMG